MRILKPFKSLNYRYLFSTTICFSFAAFIDLMAFVVIVTYNLKLGAVSLALITIFYSFPMIIASLFTARIIEKYNAGTIMQVTCLLRAVTMVLLFFYANSFYMILLLLFFKSSLTAFDSPSSMLAVRKVVDNNYQEQAASLEQLVISASKIVAPSIAGVILIFIDANNIFLISASLYVLAYFFIIPIRKCFGKDQAETEGEIADIKKSIWTLLKSDKILSFLIISIGITLLAAMIIDSFSSLLFKNIGLMPSMIGFFIASIGVGSILSNLVIGSLKRINYMRSVNIAMVIFAILFFVLGALDFDIVKNNLSYFSLVALIIPIGFLLGIGVGMIFGAQAVYIARNVPTEYIGRAVSFSNIIQLSAMLPGPIIGAILIKGFGISNTYMTCGILLMIFTIIIFIYRKKFRI